MKRLLFIANWKSYKTQKEAREWLAELSIKNQELDDKEVILCPPFTVLATCAESIQEKSLSLTLGAQDISPFDEGKYTGEISAKQIREFATYVIIGHSERRSIFAEDEILIQKKLDQAYHYGLIPILCISGIDQVINQKETIRSQEIIVAFEPLFAIGSGTPDSSQNANHMAEQIKNQLPQATVLYGGSITSENVAQFIEMPAINGVLVGSSSLDPIEFSEIIAHA